MSTDDIDVEAQWWEEFGAALESCAGQSRRFAGLLRLAGGALPAADIDAARAEATGIIRRTIAAATIALSLGERPDGKGSVIE